MEAKRFRALCLLAQASGLMHDIGKASQGFQEKLCHNDCSRDEIRHEWVSVWLLRALSSGKSWKKAWETWSEKIEPRFAPSFPKNHREIIELIIATHHRLLDAAAGACSFLGSPCFCAPQKIGKKYRKSACQDCSLYLRFTHLLQRLEKLPLKQEESVGLMFLGRVALLLADHSVSALKHPLKETELVANTLGQALNQSLSWHLQEVARVASRVAWEMGKMFFFGKQSFPGILPTKVMQAADEQSRFSWQNRIAEQISLWKGRQCLVFTMASTGSGKTRMNMRIAASLSQSNSFRCSVALNLRSLSLQTVRAYQREFGLSNEECAVVMKGFGDEEPSLPLPKWARGFFQTARERKSIATAILVSTIDLLVPAGSPQMQGQHVRAFLRILSSDVILDEIESYEPDALIAVLRLVQVIAFCGRNLICSSATLSPILALSIVRAWESGLELRNGKKEDFAVACVDELIDADLRLYAGSKSFASHFEAYLAKRERVLSQRKVLRRAFLQDLEEESVPAFYLAVEHAIERLHAEHKGHGLVRMANINTAIELARFLSDRWNILCYHANDWDKIRQQKEAYLDSLFGPVATQTREKSLIVVASPLEEIGRDHDFDWAVVEPSSVQSIVQIAGRVNRHREKALADGQYNIAILRWNLRHCTKKSPLAFVFPGYEDEVREHDLQKLLPWKGGELIVRASLRDSLFGQEDSASIARGLEPFFGEEGLFVRMPRDSFLLCSFPYEKTALRQRRESEDEWKLVVKDGIASFYRWEKTESFAGWVKNTHDILLRKEKRPSVAFPVQEDGEYYVTVKGACRLLCDFNFGLSKLYEED